MGTPKLFTVHSKTYLVGSAGFFMRVRHSGSCLNSDGRNLMKNCKNGEGDFTSVEPCT